MSFLSWGDIFTLPLGGDRIMELKHLSSDSFSTASEAYTIGALPAALPWAKTTYDQYDQPAHSPRAVLFPRRGPDSGRTLESVRRCRQPACPRHPRIGHRR